MVLQNGSGWGEFFVVLGQLILCLVLLFWVVWVVGLSAISLVVPKQIPCLVQTGEPVWTNQGVTHCGGGKIIFF